MVLLDNDGVSISSFIQLVKGSFVLYMEAVCLICVFFVSVPHPAHTSSSKDEDIWID